MSIVLAMGVESAGDGVEGVSDGVESMRHHSGLTKEDAILVGASSLKQLEKNLHDLEMGPLPPVLVDAFEDAWKAIERW
ncbi:hypothetical protein BGZ82_000750 [Podila clonocystis]|nr:hypothetical protein BGZ82_000750 [Podila clonocystis]